MTTQHDTTRRLPPLNSNYPHLIELATQLRSFGCPVSVTANMDSQTLMVNGVLTIVRFQHTENSHVPIELMHEANGNTWVHSWGITHKARMLLYVNTVTKQHMWLDLEATRELLVKHIVRGTIQLMNNSHATRLNNGPSSNVMNAWVKVSEDAEYLYDPELPMLGDYTDWLTSTLREYG
jgi:hypothetical protein